MPRGNLVRPERWTNVIDLFDDGEYSAIWGTYDERSNRCLGVRWNGDERQVDDQGYPNQGRNPLWYIEPEFVAENILLMLISRVITNPSIGNIENLQIAIRECAHNNLQ